MTRDQADAKPGGRTLPSERTPAHDPGSITGGLGQGTDLSEFDDLLDSLRDAMRSAEEDRLRSRKTDGEVRVMSQGQARAPEEPAKAVPSGAGPDEAGSLKTQASSPRAASPEDESGGSDRGEAYPDWLTNGSASEPETQAAAEVASGPGSPDEPGRLDRAALPGELEWPGEPYSDVPGAWERPIPTKRRHVYRSYESSRISAYAFRCRVTLSTNGHEYVGEAEGPSVPGVRAEIAAKATLDALCSAENGRVILSLMNARVLRFSDMPLVVVSVYGLNDEEVNRLVGVSVVENSEEQAAILATLQATDRWITGVISRSHD